VRGFTVERDATPPQVWVSAPAGVIGGAFTVTWGAVDAQAGVAWYDLDVSVDGGPWERVLTQTPITNYQYTNPPNTHVTFRVTATDHVSNAASALARTSVVRVTKYYYHGGARVALRTTGAGGSVVYWLHGDHLGSVSLVTDHASRVVAQQRFLPYGGVRYSEGTFPTDVGFTGHRGHPALGLVYMRARYYHSGLGRFVSADVVVPIPGNPQDWNRYTYVANNPLRSTDPSGHFIFNRPSWMYFVPGLNVYAYARDCATSISQAVEAYKAGERRVGVLALHATGTTDLLVRQAGAGNRLNEDVRVVFSNAPLEERLPHAVHLGVWATGTAAQIVGAGQLAKAGIQALGQKTTLNAGRNVAKAGEVWIPDYSPEAGQALVDDVVQNEFANVRLSARPQYNPYLLKEGNAEVNLLTGERVIEVGPFPVGEGYREVVVTVAHEEMHHRMWSRGIFCDVEAYVEEVAKRFARFKGW